MISDQMGWAGIGLCTPLRGIYAPFVQISNIDIRGQTTYNAMCACIMWTEAVTTHFFVESLTSEPMAVAGGGDDGLAQFETLVRVLNIYKAERLARSMIAMLKEISGIHLSFNHHPPSKDGTPTDPKPSFRVLARFDWFWCTFICTRHAVRCVAAEEFHNIDFCIIRLVGGK